MDQILVSMEKLNIEDGGVLVFNGVELQYMQQLGEAMQDVCKDRNIRVIGLPPNLRLDQLNKAQLKEVGLTHVDDTHHTIQSVLSEGGDWLGAVRSMVKTVFRNGDSVAWGSEDVLQPEPSIRTIEELCAAAVVADRNKRHQ